MIKLDFNNIRSIDGSQRDGFEEFCCQLARHETKLAGSTFSRIRGAGGDGGVECFWETSDGKMYGYQAKYFKKLDKKQLDESVSEALRVHPELVEYTICIPFDLTGKTSRKGKSEKERWDEYVTEWEKLALSKGMSVKFILWSCSQLIERLIALENHQGRIKFWFGKEAAFSNDWCEKQVKNSVYCAGPRYSAELNIEVPLAQSFEALGQTSTWTQLLAEVAGRFDESAEKWRSTFNRSSDDAKPSKATDANSKSLDKYVNRIQGWMTSLCNKEPSESTLNAIELIALAQLDCESLESSCLTDLENGKGGFNDTPGWRQFMAEYQCCFPAQYLDASREFLKALKELETWIESQIADLPTSNAMLVTGIAGSGKTHALCDAALSRIRKGLPSVLLLGEQLISGEPWDQIRKILGLNADWNRDDILSALDAAGESSGYPSVIFIDALNETTPRKNWKSHFKSMLLAIKGFEWVKLCVSCRTTYLADTLPNDLEIPRVDHVGFKGYETKACFLFFNYFNLEPPAMPLLQPEFSNPLFLRLVCESLNRNNVTELPEDSHGISWVIQLLIESNNKAISEHLDCDEKENLVGKAVQQISNQMSVLHCNELPWHDAKNVIEEVRESATRENSLFHQMIRSGLLVEDQMVDPLNDEPVNTIRFAFERVTDHLRAQVLLSGIECPDALAMACQAGGQISEIISDLDAVRQNAGVITELTVLVPQLFINTELVDFACDETRDELNRLTADGIAWRASSSITRKAIAILESQRGFSYVELILATSCRVDHPLNADYFHDVFRRQSMITRDSFLCPFLYTKFEEPSVLVRMLDWANDHDISNVSADVARLWLKVLAWVCCSSDLRIRDLACRAMIRIGIGNPMALTATLDELLSVDDEYVIERVLLTTYGVLIRTRDIKASKEAAERVWQGMFQHGQPTTNVSIRDLGRLILEFAEINSVLPEACDLARTSPPFQSSWPLKIPDDAALDSLKGDNNRAVSRLVQSCTDEDFERYVVKYAVDDFKKRENEKEDAIDLPDACSWILGKVLSWGYATNKQLTSFDMFLMGKYGTGRGRNSWAERVGKKYQKIALRQLLGHLHDNAILDWRYSHDLPPVGTLQAENERNYDPTILVREEPEENKNGWWSASGYDFKSKSTIDHETWIDSYDDFDLKSSKLVHKSPDDKTWITLRCYSSQSSRTNERWGERYRNLSFIVRPYLVDNRESEKFWYWIRKQDTLRSDILRTSKEVPTSVFVGEYPWAPSLDDFHRLDDFSDYHDNLPCRVMAASHDKTVELKYDSTERTSFNVSLPAPIFFDFRNLEWDGSCGYRLSETKELVIDCPVIRDGGPMQLLVRKYFLDQFLAKKKLSLFYSIHSERMVPGGGMSDGIGFAQKSICHWYGQDKFRSSKEKLFRISPGNRVRVT